MALLVLYSHLLINVCIIINMAGLDIYTREVIVLSCKSINLSFRKNIETLYSIAETRLVLQSTRRKHVVPKVNNGCKPHY